MFRVNGKPAIGIGVNMRDGGNNLTFGEGLHHAAESLVERFPIGIELNLVSDQPEVVREAIGEFTKALVEAVAIVLAVSFVSLGLRAGIVVALSIPLVLVIVFGAWRRWASACSASLSAPSSSRSASSSTMR